MERRPCSPLERKVRAPVATCPRECQAARPEREEESDMSFQSGVRYRAVDIHNIVGGQHQYYLSTRDGIVVAAKLRRELNPDAPEVLLVGQGPLIYRNATIAAAQHAPFPVFVAEDAAAGFFFIDLFIGSGMTEDPAVLGHFSRRSGRSDLRAACFLERAG